MASPFSFPPSSSSFPFHLSQTLETLGQWIVNALEMTSPAKKIPDAQWESHRASIRALYLDEDKTLDETVQAMSECHAFHATRAQLVRRLRNWGFDKNIKSGDWHQAVRARELEGKELIINGRAINTKRLKKRLGRSDFKAEEGRTRALSAPSASPSPSPSVSKPQPVWDDMPETPLLTAVRYRDLVSVQSLLDFGAAISLDPDSPHYRPFITAINQGYTLILRSLLAACQRPKSSTITTSDDHIRGYDALLRRAVNSLSLESTKCLLDCGADIRTIRGMPCFNKMEESRRKKAMQLIVALVEMGADIGGFCEQDGTEPFLCTAIRCENFAMVSFLLRRGADPTRFPLMGSSSPVHLIMTARDSIFSVEALKALESHGADVGAYESVSNVHAPVGCDMSYHFEAMLADLMDGRRPGIFALRATPMQAACLCSREKLVTSLIEAGASVNAPPAKEGGFTAVQIACLRGFAALFDILVEAGADINAPAASEFGFTALQCAILGGHTDMAAKLLCLGADINAPPSEVVGLTALQAAVTTGNLQMVKRLLDSGANVNAAPALEMGRTALQAAVHRGDTEMIKILLQAGANPIDT